MPDLDIDRVAATMQRLLDRAEIGDLVHRYVLSVDTRDWALYRSCFAEEVRIRFEPPLAGVPDEPIPADTWVENARRVPGALAATQHFCSIYSTEINGDEALAIACFQASHYEPGIEGGPTFEHKGYYRHHCRRTPDGWKIAEVAVSVLWGEGNRTILDRVLANSPHVARPSLADAAQ